ncbi:PH domain-containing protein [Microbacterium sp. ZW T5_45]|uniref:PH domain-containing protein n=1 Tax=Microbacterium sp. ZW T5_45 TaxID=3378080 RepID=UPI0038519E6E
MSDQRLPGAPLPPDASQTLADGEWHRMHPLTPLFKGGLVLLIIGGFLIANMRDRVITWLVDLFEPGVHYSEYNSGDPVDWVLSNNFALLALLGVLALVIVLIAIFWVIWRFQQFRITGDHVEVRKGIVFRSHRRAPLDRVQGVNLTRPFPARVIGLAKLEVVGAGTDANVELEYLATSKAEAVRADILRLASGARAARDASVHGAPGVPGAPTSVREQLVGSVNSGVNGLITGVDLADVAPESVVKIPTGRLVGSQLISSVLWLVFFGIIFAVALGGTLIGGVLDGDPETALIGLGVGLGVGIPMVIAVVGITWAQISKSLRYSIAPTPDGVRITYGLLTTVTETLPPGRIFAVEVTQSLLWRPFGWWTIKINRMSGKSAAQQQSGTAQQFNVVLPVGKRADVERVLALILPDAPVSDIPLIWEHGILGPVAGDPYRTMPARAWWRRPFSWKRHGYAVTAYGLLLRRGTFWRKLAVFPLARIQGISLSQGPIDRAQRVSGAQVHSVTGVIQGLLSGLERADALELVNGVSAAAALAAARDHSHRWGQYAPDAQGHTLASAAGFAAPAAGSFTQAVPGAPGAPAYGGAPGAPSAGAAAHNSYPYAGAPQPAYPTAPSAAHPAPPFPSAAHPAPPLPSAAHPAPPAPPAGYSAPAVGQPAPPLPSAAHSAPPAPPTGYSAPADPSAVQPAPLTSRPAPSAGQQVPPAAHPAPVIPPLVQPTTRAEARRAASAAESTSATASGQGPADADATTPGNTHDD